MSKAAERTLVVPMGRRLPERRAQRQGILALLLLGGVLAGAALLPDGALSVNAAARALPPQQTHLMGCAPASS